jgi:hypothetical protein
VVTIVVIRYLLGNPSPLLSRHLEILLGNLEMPGGCNAARYGRTSFLETYRDDFVISGYLP